MNKTMCYIKKAKLSILALIFAVIFSVLPIINANAWGPVRTCVRDLVTSTAEDCPDYIHPAATETTFNSFIDRLLLDGITRIDERNFVLICEINTATNDCVGGSGKYVDEVNIVPGKTYEVYILFHNNGADNLNPGVMSYDARVNAVLPVIVDANVKTAVSSTISWDIAGQTERGRVWDEAYITSTKKVDITYITGSAKIFMNELSPEGGSVLGLTSIAMPQTMFSTNGTFLGHYDTEQETIVLDGVVPGCVKYAGYIKYRFAVSEPEPEVKPCPTNPNLPIDDPKCKPCPTNPDLNFDDPKCKPVTNIPDTGIFEPALVSIISIIGLGIIMSATILYSTRHKNR